MTWYIHEPTVLWYVHFIIYLLLHDIYLLTFINFLILAVLHYTRSLIPLYMFGKSLTNVAICITKHELCKPYLFSDDCKVISTYCVHIANNGNTLHGKEGVFHVQNCTYTRKLVLAVNTWNLRWTIFGLFFENKDFFWRIAPTIFFLQFWTIFSCIFEAIYFPAKGGNKLFYWNRHSPSSCPPPPPRNQLYHFLGSSDRFENWGPSRAGKAQPLLNKKSILLITIRTSYLEENVGPWQPMHAETVSCSKCHHTLTKWPKINSNLNHRVTMTG